MSSERAVEIPLPDGSVKKGYEIPVSESLERWSELSLEDGTTLLVKQVVTSVVRAEDIFDPDGNPMYYLKCAPIVTIKKAPDHLRRGGGLRK